MRASGAGLLAAICYLMSPLLGATHVEGLTAQIQIGAIAANAGHLLDANVLYPVHAEYFYLTRVGVVVLLQGLMRMVGTGDAAFHWLTGLSFVVFVAASVAVARRHLAASLPRFTLALLLTPGLAELGFYFNDNVVSAAFGMLGLVVLPSSGASGRTVLGRGLLAGAALGFAIMARPDAILLLPVVAALAWLETEDWVRLLGVGAAVGAGALLVFVCLYWVTGASLIDAVQIGRFFDHLQSGYRSKSRLAWTFVVFFGLPNLVLLPVGAYCILRESRLKRSAVLIGLPLLLLGFICQSALEARMLYPLLAPFVLIHGASGLGAIGAALSGVGARRWLASAWLGLAVLIWVMPPVLVPVSDGPRAILGRAWSPWLWFRWQAMTKDTLAIGNELSAIALRSPRIVVATTSFDPDHFLRLRLEQDGWRSAPAGSAWQGCQGFEVWRRGEHELDLVRTENPHLSARQPPDYVMALQIETAFRCAGLRDAPVYVYDKGDYRNPVKDYLYEAAPALARETVAFGWPGGAADFVWTHLIPFQLRDMPRATALGRWARLGPDQVAGLSQAAASVVAGFGATLPGYDGVMAQFGRGVWKPPRQR